MVGELERYRERQVLYLLDVPDVGLPSNTKPEALAALRHLRDRCMGLRCASCRGDKCMEWPT